MLKHFCELKFKNEQNLKTSLEMVRQCLCSDKELPVRVEAAVALQVLLVEQEKGNETQHYVRWFVELSGHSYRYCFILCPKIFLPQIF